MGYEGNAVGLDDRSLRQELTAQAMELLLQAHTAVGGDVISAGGTGTFDINTYANEIQAGSYALMDTPYAKPGPRLKPAATLPATASPTPPPRYPGPHCRPPA